MPIADEQPHTITRYVEGEATRLPPARRRPALRGGLVLLGILVLLVGALVYAGVGGTSKPADPGVRATPLSGAALPTGNELDVPVGYPHTAAGAASAASNYAIVYGSVGMYHPTTRHALLAVIADPASLAGLRGQLDEAFGSVLANYGLDADGNPPAGQTFTARAFIAGTNVVDYRDDAATVDVWASNLVGLAGVGATKPVSQIWSTLRVTLRWTDGDWKWVSTTVTPGPTPVTGSQVPSDTGDLARAAQQFQNGIWGPPRAR